MTFIMSRIQNQMNELNPHEQLLNYTQYLLKQQQQQDQQYRRGFFCGDLTLYYPYKSETITLPTLLLIMLLLPLLFIVFVEVLRLWKGFRLRYYMRSASQPLMVFSCGFISTYITTELGKNIVGRLRPHFFVACQPRLYDGTNCAAHKNHHYYVDQYYCSNNNLSDRQIHELYVSFPSGHSSLSFYAMLFVALYLHAIGRQHSYRCRLVWRCIRYILQFVCLTVAWFISLSRVADYWHHWSDVLAGAVMGIIYACVCVCYVGRLLQINANDCNSCSHCNGCINCNINRCSTSNSRTKSLYASTLNHTAATTAIQPLPTVHPLNLTTSITPSTVTTATTSSSTISAPSVIAIAIADAVAAAAATTKSSASCTSYAAKEHLIADSM